MVQRFLDRLVLQARWNFIGRTQEIAHLYYLLDDLKLPVIFVHGIGGIGKSSLLNSFSTLAQLQETIFITLDCRAVTPSRQGFLNKLSEVSGGDAASLEDIVLRLSALAQRVVLILDSYEHFRDVDSWMRQGFLPALEGNVQVIFSGRAAPPSAWFTTPGWEGMVQTIHLGPLNHTDAETLLLHCGVPDRDSPGVLRFTHGHPLALKLAGATITAFPELHLNEVENQYVAPELTRLYLSDVPDPTAWAALEAASVVRRCTRSLLKAMLPDLNPDDVFLRLQELPFVEPASDGLRVDPLVQQAIANHLRSVDPQRYHTIRRAAVHQLHAELSAACRSTVWRYTADLMYLIDNPLIHAAFFPDGIPPHPMEPAAPVDFGAVQALTLGCDGPETAAIVQHWWNTAPQAFFVSRGRQMEVTGYNITLRVQPAANQISFDDVITHPFWQHLKANPIPKDQYALLLVKNLAAGSCGQSAPEMGSCWLNLMGFSFENHQIPRIYCLIHEKALVPALKELGFRVFGSVVLDGKTYDSMVNEPGLQQIPGWLSSLEGSQPGFNRPVCLDEDARELSIGGAHLGLTALEFKLIQYLDQHEGKAVSRDELLNRVWGYDYVGGSNVVDAIVRSLRKKMGDHAKSIQAVNGVGYRLRWSSE